ncbi:MAG TPA: DNA repair protein RecN [Verrucomicrobiota bacterium]|nr:DNA repair protein RecN [Verrucomicrobiota bacterium]
MLVYLRIKNFALVEDISIELDSGCNVITGETGAGKSILIGALGLVLGLRGDKNLIRSGADQAVVEAVFDISQVLAPIPVFLDSEEIEACEDGLLRIKRSLSTKASNRQFVNGTPVSVSVLSSLGDWLVDIHGPHDHQSLLYPARQLEILDSFGKSQPDYTKALKEYLEGYKNLRAYELRRKELVVDDQSYRRQLDLLRYQVQEIESSSLNEEDALLDDRYTRSAHSVDILRSVQAGIEILSESENSILTRLGLLGRHLHEATRLDSAGLKEITEKFELLHELLVELQSLLADYAENVEVDPYDLQQIEERLNLINGLKRKYGKTIEEILDFEKNARVRLNLLENRDIELAEIDQLIQKENSALRKHGKALTEKRNKLIPSLELKVLRHLKELGFKQSLFNISLQPIQNPMSELGPTGMDRVEFLFSPNPGELPKPLRTIASSGEIARVMLALKTALAEADSVPVLVFDEVDANVGGETAFSVGKKMREIGNRRQVICITHLAPVAASGDIHFSVEKMIQNQRTHIRVNRLKEEERLVELSRMLGGQMETARKYAQTLLFKYKTNA